MTSKQKFITNWVIGITALILLVAGIAVKAIWPKDVQPVTGDINSLMFTSGMILGGLVRHVLGFAITSPGQKNESKSEESVAPKVE